MTPTPRPDTSLLTALSRTLAIVAILLCTWIFPTPSHSARQLLSFEVGEDPGTLVVWARDAGDALPVVTVDKQPGVQSDGGEEATGPRGSVIDLAVTGTTQSNRYKPLTVVVDTSNITAERLGKIKDMVTALVGRELKNDSKSVLTKHPAGQLKLEKLSDFGENSMAWKALMSGLRVDPNPEPGKPYYSKIGRPLSAALAMMPGTSRSKVWAVVFSSLCMDSEEEPLDLKNFKGPVRLITWDDDLEGSCNEGKEKWLEASKNDQLEVFTLGSDDAAINTAMAGLTALKDVKLQLGPREGSEGIDYRGGSIAIDVSLAGATDESNITIIYTKDLLHQSAPEWGRSAKIKAKKERMTVIASGFVVLLLLVVIGVVFKARSTAVDFAKWEAVGEAEDLAAPLVDPDAWNATIFQLTGAMPIITEAAAKTAQLGPAGPSQDDGEATRMQEMPDRDEAPPPPSPQAPADPAAAADDASATRTAEQPQAEATVGDKRTGMTVSMGVLDDGSGYDALTPFEIGVLQEGKPVARKTKMFRKSFSIGRATDNRVVIQKDDTVHRYHVVIRPAVEGKEWWLEVSPTASNRTRLNGKDLRPGGRYRVPGRFRLQLGESTEVRGRLSKKKAA